MPVGWAQMGLGHIGVACTAGQRDCCGDAVSYNCSLFCSLVESTSSVCTRYCCKFIAVCLYYVCLFVCKKVCLYLESAAVAADCGTNGYVCMPSADSAGLCAVATQWWMVGMALCFAGTVISNFGTQFQKIALRRNKQLIRETFRTHGPGLVLASVQEKQSWQLPLWFGGAFMMGIGSVLDILSLAFAAQSLLACLAASTFVITIVSAVDTTNFLRPRLKFCRYRFHPRLWLASNQPDRTGSRLRSSRSVAYLVSHLLNRIHEVCTAICRIARLQFN
jgi:hypothetical protein